jgi:hypothetical protein
MDEDRSPFRQRGFVLSAGLIAVVVVLAVGVVVSGGGSSAHARRVPRPRMASTSGAGVAATSTAPVATSTAGESACGLPAGSQQVPALPPSAHWVLVGAMAAPSAPSTFGPGKTVDGFRECFAHNPTGALFAAINFWAAGTEFAPATIYAHLAADTPLRGEAIQSSAGDDSRLNASGDVQLAAFQFASYSPAEADLSIVLQTTSGGLLSIACTMLWQDGDWHYEIPPNGAPPAGEVQSLDGYVAWSGA